MLGPRPFDIDVGGALERVSSDWQALVDARAAIDLDAHLALVVGVDNALDAGDPELFQVRPRNLYLGLHGRL